MYLLLDNGVPAPLRRFLSDHTITTAYLRGWADMEDGNLLSLADEAGFDLLLTTDQNIVDQQKLSRFRIAVVVLRTQDWRIVRRYVRRIARTVNAAQPGTYTEIDMPFRQRRRAKLLSLSLPCRKKKNSSRPPSATSISPPST